MAPETDLAVYKDVLLVLGTAGVVVPLMSRLKVSPVLAFPSRSQSSPNSAWSFYSFSSVWNFHSSA